MARARGALGRGCLLCALGATGATQFWVEPQSARCISEELPEKALFTGDYSIEPTDGFAGSVKVLGPLDAVLFERQTSDPHHFSVTSETTGVHKVCFANDNPVRRRVVITLRKGLEVDDHSQIARKDHVEQIEKQLDRMREMAMAIKEEMIYMRGREEEMRDTNESTNTRVLWFNIMTLTLIGAMGLWQIYYLKRYFQMKKLI
ncbi:hypothetical protein KFE25_011490 [Diacronema lutheri]|uniref:GOLD domain-containing protein n=1 Tax=Diacronema lutheri TaxID=2081491 RepID=A0A8J5XMW3_DIALT|nr:hypothetical protein KFE25_009827 [Diacronema lutheri]KAG8462040.1 hypothetical protein KFE25_011490 [Diacronema lutheri]